MTVLLTSHGTILCWHLRRGVLVHRPCNAPGDDVQAVELPVPVEQTRASFRAFVEKSDGPTISTPDGPLASLRFIRSADQRTFHLFDDPLFLCAEAGGDTVTLSRREAHAWESFLPISQVELDWLGAMRTGHWLVDPAQLPVPPQQIRLEDGFILKIGALPVDLRYQFPLDLAAWPHRLTLLREGWRILPLTRYRPLVYLTAFQSPLVLQQLRLSLRSLCEHGRYDGDVLVMTDRPADEIAVMLPDPPGFRLTVMTIAAPDIVGFVAAKYSLLEWPQAAAFQPILFSDPDVIFDREIAPMLWAIACADRIAAPLEQFSPLATTESVGAALLQRDGRHPGSAAGFNGGTLGIPNLAQHGTALRLIRRIIANHAALHGRGALTWGDQEVANYTAFVTNTFGTGLISRFVRFEGMGADPDGRRGILHVWPAFTSERKVEAMTAYLAALDGVRTEQPSPE